MAKQNVMKTRISYQNQANKIIAEQTTAQRRRLEHNTQRAKNFLELLKIKK